MQSSGVRNVARLHVLIVDDDPGFAQTCLAMLRHDGYAVSVAASARAAMERLGRDGCLRAMLLDWRLPDGTALDVLQWMATRARKIPTALVTGLWIDPEFGRAEAEARRLGVHACIRRGLDFDEPGDIVKRLLDPFWAQHNALVSGDASAADVLARALPSRVIRRLRSRFRQADEDLIVGVALEATAEYLRKPSRFEPARYVSIEHFAYMVARRMLWNELRSERRRRDREEEYARLRLQITVGDDAEKADRRGFVGQALVKEHDVTVRCALRAWLDGERGIGPWLAIPGVAALPATLQHVAIDRYKDAFRARVKRLARRPH